MSESSGSRRDMPPGFSGVIAADEDEDTAGEMERVVDSDERLTFGVKKRWELVFVWDGRRMRRAWRHWRVICREEHGMIEYDGEEGERAVFMTHV
jgi:hypothetical protein